VAVLWRHRYACRSLTATLACVTDQVINWGHAGMSTFWWQITHGATGLLCDCRWRLGQFWLQHTCINAGTAVISVFVWQFSQWWICKVFCQQLYLSLYGLVCYLLASKCALLSTGMFTPCLIANVLRYYLLFGCYLLAHHSEWGWYICYCRYYEREYLWVA
jgi:hypothetical protein